MGLITVMATLISFWKSKGVGFRILLLSTKIMVRNLMLRNSRFRGSERIKNDDKISQ